MQTTNDQILLTMEEILRYNEKIGLEKLIAPENLPTFPLTTYKQFLSFESLTKEDPIVNQYMVSSYIIIYFLLVFHICLSKYI